MCDSKVSNSAPLKGVKNSRCPAIRASAVKSAFSIVSRFIVYRKALLSQDFFGGSHTFEDGFFHVGVLPATEAADGISAMGIKITQDLLGQACAVLVIDDIRARNAQDIAGDDFRFALE